MAVSISIGDFIAISKIIGSIASALRDSARAPAEFQEIERELTDLQKTLNRIEHLEVPASHQPAANAIKCAALSCQTILEEFNAKLSKYRTSFNNDGPTARLKAAGKKLQWEFQMKDEVMKLRVYIAAHVGSLNLSLLTLGLESTTILSTKVQHWRTEQERNLSDATTLALSIQKQHDTQNAMLTKVIEILSTTLEPRLQVLIDLTQKVWESNIQNTQILERNGRQCPPPDLGHTWLQAPVRLEDHLGRYIPIPSEYSFEMMEVAVLEKCKADPGARRLRLGQYEISNARDSNQVITKDRFTCFIPGSFLRMAILLYGIDVQADRCPVSICGSQMISDYGCGGKTCDACKVWFSPESKDRAKYRAVDVEGSKDEQIEPLQDQTESGHRSKKRKIDSDTSQHSSEPEDDLSFFRNIRLGGSAVGQAAQDKALQELRHRFPALNLETLTSFLKRCNGDVKSAIRSLQDAISTYEITTKDTTLFSTTWNTTSLVARDTARISRTTDESTISSTSQVAQSIELSAKANSNRNSPPLEPLRLSRWPSRSPTPDLDSPYPSAASSRHSSPDCPPTPSSPPASPSAGTRKRKRIRPTRGDAVLVSFLADLNRPEIASFAGEAPWNADGDEQPSSP